MDGEVVSYWGLTCNSLMTNDTEHLFMFVGHLYIFGGVSNFIAHLFFFLEF